MHDNAILAHDDRSQDPRRRIPARIADLPTVLVDGFACGTWRIDDGRLEMRLFAGVTASDKAALEAEGERLLAFTGAEGRGAVCIRDP